MNGGMNGRMNGGMNGGMNDWIDNKMRAYKQVYTLYVDFIRNYVSSKPI